MRAVRLRRVLLGGALLVVVASAAALIFGGHRIAGEQSAYTLPAAGQCVPSELNRSDLLPGTKIAVAPLPYSLDASPQTQISMLGAPVRDLQDVQVIGSMTGPHPGHLRSYSQSDGGSFVPDQPFRSGETVTVTGKYVSGSKSKDFDFHFVIAHESPVAHKPPTPNPKPKPGEIEQFHSTDLEPPAVKLTTLSEEASKGDLFLDPYSGPSADGPLIVGEKGETIWFHPLPAGTESTNLQVQEWNGKPVLTWWQGYIPPQGFGEGEEVVADSSYKEIIHIHPGNGYTADLHEFHLNGRDHTAVMSIFNPIRCDLSSVGGPKGAAVTDSGFEEVDVKTGLVRRQWFPIDHVPLDQSYSQATKASTSWPYDYFHLNSVDQQSDGDTLISSRNTSALYELDTLTGQVRLQIGGKHSSIDMGPGTSTAYQHDATVLPNGDVSVFDNGGSPRVHPESRGVIESLDTTNRTARMITEYEHDEGPMTANSQGNVEALPDGDIFVGWGEEPFFSEYTASGQVLLDGQFVVDEPEQKPHVESYRTYRFPWTGTPTTQPSIAAEATEEGPVDVWASWNGATQVASWQLLAGPSEDDLEPVEEPVQRDGFETTLEAPEGEAYVEVQALDASGHVIGTSPAIRG